MSADAIDGGRAGPAALAQSAAIRSRLRTVAVQVAGIGRMYDEGHPCPEILEQLGALRAALDSLSLGVLQDHVNGCFEPVVHDTQAEARAAQLLLATRRCIRPG
ncbi:MAG TPA: metal-sensitive transcriptional regulator [Candidatus Dormibacteraeota bacterium]|nr:metal-sensitive transcriptional regulator [Candidatus Dormibacteraeota bacterium]